MNQEKKSVIWRNQCEWNAKMWCSHYLNILEIAKCYTVVLTFNGSIYPKKWNPIARDKEDLVVKVKINGSVSTKNKFDYACYIKHSNVQSSNICN